MNPFYFPTDNVPVRTSSVQSALRHYLDSEAQPLLAEYDGEVFRVPSTADYARKLLNRPNTTDPYQLLLIDIARAAVEEPIPLVKKWSSGFSNRLTRFLREDANQPSLFDQFIVPEAILLVSELFGFTSPDILRRLHIEASLGVSEPMPSARGVFVEDSILPGLLLASGFPTATEDFCRLVYSVSVMPMANFAGILIYEMTRGQWTQLKNFNSFWFDIVNRVAPTYPGIFRESASGLPFLIPTTWPEFRQNFTFGGGIHSCPGRNVVYRFCQEFYHHLPLEILLELTFVERSTVPFGFEDILLGSFEC